MKPYIVTLTPGSGIGSVVIGIINALCYMKTNNIIQPLFININKASNPGNILFTCFLDLEQLTFIKIINTPIQVILNKTTNKHQVITPGDYIELWYTQIVEQTYSFKMKCDMFDYLWVLKDDVIKYVLLNTENYNSIDLCINIRRGDKITLEPQEKQGSIKEFISAIDTIDNIQTIFHTSDDYSTFLEFKNERPEWNIVTFCTNKDTGYFLKDINDSQNPEDAVNHVRKFMKELEMMKRSVWFVGTKTTNVGLMVELMRKGKNIIFIY